jgi:dipeptidyl-peptidase 4
VRSGVVRRIEYPYAQLLVTQADLLAIRQTWFSKDSTHLYAVAFGDNMESAFLFDADLQTGRVRAVIHETASPRMDLNSTSYSPPNVYVIGNCDQVIWFSQRGGWGHLYLYDGHTGALRNQITRGSWLVRDLIHIDEKSRRIYFTAGGREPGNPYYRYLYRIKFDGSDLKLLSPEPADHLLASPLNEGWILDGAAAYEPVSPSGRYVVYTSAPINQAPQTHIRSTSDAHEVAVLATADVTEVLVSGFQPPEELKLKAADGKSDLWTVIYRPRNLDPNRQYPIIDMQYASPLTAVVPRNFLTALDGVPGFGSPAALAQLGFIVIVVDAKGTAFRSRDFSQGPAGYLDTMGLDDHVSAIRELGARYSYADTNRVGIVGLSFGGWTALRAMLEYSDFFKVAVAGVPPANWANMYLDYHFTVFQGRPVYGDGSQSRPNDTEVPRNYLASDGNRHAQQLKGKVMIIMGGLDQNVLPGSTLQFVDALMTANKDFDLLFLPKANHAESRNPYTVRRTWDYFVRNLRGLEPPHFDLDPVAMPARD